MNDLVYLEEQQWILMLDTFDFIHAHSFLFNI